MYKYKFKAMCLIFSLEITYSFILGKKETFYCPQLRSYRRSFRNCTVRYQLCILCGSKQDMNMNHTLHGIIQKIFNLRASILYFPESKYSVQ